MHNQYGKINNFKATSPHSVIKRKTAKLAIREIISCLIVIVCTMTSSAWVQAQSSASSIIPVLSLLLLSDNHVLTDVVDISTGNRHSCARLNNGTVKCWGYNYFGQHGDGTTTNRLTPVTVNGIKTATVVATGWYHSCVRLSNGTMKCWGYNNAGRLGDGTNTRRLTPVSVSGITTATAIATGDDHSCASFRAS